jgi:hypothetical protein
VLVSLYVVSRMHQRESGMLAAMIARGKWFAIYNRNFMFIVVHNVVNHFINAGIRALVAGLKLLGFCHGESISENSAPTVLTLAGLLNSYYSADWLCSVQCLTRFWAGSCKVCMCVGANRPLLFIRARLLFRFVLAARRPPASLMRRAVPGLLLFALMATSFSEAVKA